MKQGLQTREFYGKEILKKGNMLNRTELSYDSFPQLFDVTNICLELSETTELYKTMKRNISYVVFKKNT